MTPHKPAPKSTLDVERLWQVQRIGAPSLSPEGTHAAVSVAAYSMERNAAASSLWLLSTLGGRARRLTACGTKDAQPAFSPKGDRIAFVAKREQEGVKDEQAQLYVIAVDGGEARRVGPVPTGVEAFAWCPDGRRVIAVSWVWPQLSGTAAQARQMKDAAERKETGYATQEAQYRYWDHNLPQGRVARLLHLDTKTGRSRDLLEGTDYELSRAEPDAKCFDISPDGGHVVFAFDPAPQKRSDGRFALAEIDLRSGRITEIVRDGDWDCTAPRYSPDGQRIAFIASHQGRHHTLPGRLALWHRDLRRWEVVSEAWDQDVHAPLRWDTLSGGDALLLCSERRGRRHLWRFDLATRDAAVVVEGGWVQAFDQAANMLVTLADAADHPGRIHAHTLAASAAPGALGSPRVGLSRRRIETFNDDLLQTVAMGRTEERWVQGAQGEPVQVWLTLPPGFSARRRYPLLHNIHGGPHTAAGDTWHYRWNTQVFAAQGYVVASVNYHGSSSFGHAFLDSITHRWGELELQDIEAATDALVREPWIDPQRVFAAGGSYGGYLVAWMNAHVAPGRYRAYICHAGCFDWTAMFADDAYHWHAKELGGWYWDDMGRIHRQSPHAHAARMRTPTLVIHGALDYRVPDAQGLAYYNTLKARDVPARLLWFPDENHWILKPRNSRQWYGEFFDWLRAHDAARPKSRKASTAPSVLRRRSTATRTRRGR